jgi:hypothetical protein
VARLTQPARGRDDDPGPGLLQPEGGDRDHPGAPAAGGSQAQAECRAEAEALRREQARLDERQEREPCGERRQRGLEQRLTARRGSSREGHRHQQGPQDAPHQHRGTQRGRPAVAEPGLSEPERAASGSEPGHDRA